MRDVLFAVVAGAALCGAAPPTFTQTPALVIDESSPTQVVANFVVRLLDGDGGMDGFTGTAADVQVMTTNAAFFTTPPQVSSPAGGASPPGAPGAVGCDPVGCSLTLTYTLAPYASGAVDITVTITDANMEMAMQTTTLTVREVNDAPLPSLASSVGTPANPVTATENGGAQMMVPLLVNPIPPGPPPEVTGAAPFGGESTQTIASVTCTPTQPQLFDAMGPPTVAATGELSFTPARGAVGRTVVVCTVRDSADDPTTTADDATFTFTINIVAGQDCASGEAGIAACDGRTQTCVDDGMGGGDNLLNNNFVCQCNNGGQSAVGQAAPLCDDCAAGSFGATACTDGMARWRCVDSDPSPQAQGTYTCSCTNGGGQGTPPTVCDDCAAGAAGTMACGSVSTCLDPDNGDPSQQNSFTCTCNNRGGVGMNAAPTDCDDCATNPCGVGQTCMDPNRAPTSQGDHVCQCANMAGMNVGGPVQTCNDCVGVMCGAGQTCVDPDPSPAAQNNHQCTCDNGGGVGNAAPAMACDDCALPTRCGADQRCTDPNTAPTSQGDHQCTCTLTIYGTFGVATGQPATCPRPPEFVPGSTTVTVLEDSPPYSAVWSPSVTDVDGNAMEFRLTYVSGIALSDVAISDNGILSFTPPPDAFGTAVYDVYLVDNGIPTGAPPGFCPMESAWCRSGATVRLTIRILPVDDPPTVTCANTTMVIPEDSGTVVLPYASNLSAGANESNATLRYEVYTDNPGLFSLPPTASWLSLTFAPLQGAEGEAAVEVRVMDGGGTAVCNLRIVVVDVNDLPSFTDQGPVSVPEDSGRTVVPSWATSISAGGWTGALGSQVPNERDRRVAFLVAGNTSNLLLSPPTIHPVTGDLTIHPAPNVHGTLSLNVTLRDSLGNVSVVHPLLITITPVNDPPDFVGGGVVTVDETLPLYNASWATAITPGPHETEGVRFVVNMPPNDLFTVPPTVSPAGNLTFSPRRPGRVTGSVHIVDDSGATGPSYPLTIVVLPVNYPPSFDLFPPVVSTVKGGPPEVRRGFLFNISSGEPSWRQQTVSFDVLVNDTRLFTTQPHVVHTGGGTADLRFTPAKDRHGVALATVRAVDSGGAQANRTFLIVVAGSNNPPSYSKGSDITVLEDVCLAGCNYSAWAQRITPGVGEDGTQSVTFTVLPHETRLFPSISLSSTGTLSFTTTPNASGASLVTVTATDSANATTSPATFLITVLPVNDPPSFTPGPPIRLTECLTDSIECLKVFPGWATNRSPGPPDESAQRLVFTVDTSRPDLFAVPPTIDGETGTLRFTLNKLANTRGEPVTFLVTLCDTGGTANMGQNCVQEVLNMTIGALPTAGHVVPGGDVVAVEDEGLVIRLGWATATSQPPTPSVVQCAAQNTLLFLSGPNLTLPSGDLVFQTAQDAHGKSVVQCAVNGTLLPHFTITILPVNDAPRFTNRNLSIPLTNFTGVTATGTTNQTTGLFDPTTFFAWGVVQQNVTFGAFPGVLPGTNLIPGPQGSYAVVTQFSSSYVVSGRDLVVLENWDGLQQSFVIQYAEPTTITAGAPDEDTTQSLHFETSCTNLGLFDRAPSTAPSGLLTFRLRPYHSGMSYCTLVLVDNGDTERGGVRRSTPWTFAIVVLDVHNPPEFVRGADITVLEDSGEYRRTWATQLFNREGGSTFMHIAPLGGAQWNDSLFSVYPHFDPPPSSAVLNFVTAPDAYGKVEAMVWAESDGGARSKSVGVTLNVLPVNDPPHFTLVTPYIKLQEDGPPYNRVAIANPVTGPLNEAWQTLRFTITATGSPSRTSRGVGDQPLRAPARHATQLQDEAFALFTEAPVLHPSGNLTFVLAPDAWGVQVFNVCAVDNGGRVNGGADSWCERLTVDVASVNDPPRASTAGLIEVAEGSGAVRVPCWLSILYAGPVDEGTAAVLTLATTCPSQPALFSNPPQVEHPSGDVVFTLLPEANGRINCTVAVQDSGGAVGYVALPILVWGVNDPPSFTPAFTVVEWYEDGGPFSRRYATGIKTGPADEAVQTVSFRLRPVSGRLPGPSGSPTTDHTNPADAAAAASTLFASDPPPRVSAPGYLNFTPAADQYGEVEYAVFAQDSGGNLNNGKDSSMEEKVVIRILSVNDPPSFVPSSAVVTLVEDQGLRDVPGSPDQVGVPTQQMLDPQTTVPGGSVVVKGWAADISPGPDNEAWQTVRFVVQWPTLNVSLFQSPPAVHGPSGDLILPLSADTHGTANFSVKAVDNGGRTRGGVDESPEQYVQVRVLPVNDPPSVIFGVAGNKATIYEDSPEVIADFATGLFAGPREQGQSVEVVASGASNASLLEEVTFYRDGTLSVKPVKDANGKAKGWIHLRDNGGTDNGGIDTRIEEITVEVIPVNDPPSFRLRQSTVSVAEDCGRVEVKAVVASISPGPPDEYWQTVQFRLLVPQHVANFAVLPEMDSQGNLFFSPAHDFAGEIPVGIQACDNGGAEGGGQPCGPQSVFTISVTAINDPPSFTPGAHVITVDSIQGKYAAPWATDIKGGPQNEDQKVEFVLKKLTNEALFASGGLPQVTSDGILTFTVGGGGWGNSTVLLALKDSEGSETPPYEVLIQVLDPSAGALVAVLDEPFDTFDTQAFRSRLARLLGITYTCIVLLETQPSTVRVSFRFTDCSGRTAADLRSQYLTTVEEDSLVRRQLNMISTYPLGRPPTPPALTPNDDNAGSLVWILVPCVVALLVVVVAVALCIRKWRRRKALDEGAVPVDTEAVGPFPHPVQAPSSRYLHESQPYEIPAEMSGTSLPGHPQVPSQGSQGSETSQAPFVTSNPLTEVFGRSRPPSAAAANDAARRM